LAHPGSSDSTWCAMRSIAGYDVVGVCRQRSVGKLDAFKERIPIVPGDTNDRAVIKRAVAGCDGVLTVLVPWRMRQYASGTAQAVLDYARDCRLPDAICARPCGNARSTLT